MGLQQPKIESLPFVTAELNYLAPITGKPRTYAFDPPPGEPKTTVLPEPHEVPIFDARLIAGEISLDREGFALIRHPTVVKNFYDDKEVKAVYYPAVEAFLKGKTLEGELPQMAATRALANAAPLKYNEHKVETARGALASGLAALAA